MIFLKSGEIELKWERWKLETKFMEKNKNLIYIVLAFVAGLLLMYLFNNYKIEKKNNTENTEISYQKSDNQNQDNSYSYENSSKNNQDDFEGNKSDFSNDNNIFLEITYNKTISSINKIMIINNII